MVLVRDAPRAEVEADLDAHPPREQPLVVAPKGGAVAASLR
jgi:hypothetical protein